MPNQNNICYVNEEYFQVPSRAMFYTLGVMFGGYVPFREEGVLYRSNQKSLVELVRDQLGADCEITSDPRPRRSSHWFAIDNASELRESLEDFNVRGNKHHQHLPLVPREYWSHFARGVLDDCGRVYVYKPNAVEVSINLFGNTMFMKEFHSVLIREAGVRNRPINTPHLIYQGKDAAAIARWMYQDWRTIVQEKIYLPEKAAIYLQGMNPPPRKIMETSKRLTEKVKIAKKLLRKGMRPWRVAQKVGFAHQVMASAREDGRHFNG